MTAAVRFRPLPFPGFPHATPYSRHPVAGDRGGSAQALVSHLFHSLREWNRSFRRHSPGMLTLPRSPAYAHGSPGLPHITIPFRLPCARIPGRAADCVRKKRLPQRALAPTGRIPPTVYGLDTRNNVHTTTGKPSANLFSGRVNKIVATFSSRWQSTVERSTFSATPGDLK